MILCSRLKCGCMASAFLCGNGIDDKVTKKDEDLFRMEEECEGHIVAWEDREFVWAERCPLHEAEYIMNHPDYHPDEAG